MSLMLSGDAKPRLKWTQELHERFVDAVNQLGGANKATPKSVMRVMGVSGLTLYHLKSHLQKYRMGKNQQSESYYEDSEQESCFTGQNCDEEKNQINESLQIAKALQVQMEVQRKLHEQIEVQRHLQLRIEAQGKYLQSVLKKAHETLAHHSSSSTEQARSQLSQLVALVDTGHPNPSSSVLTKNEDLFIEDAKKRHAGSSPESSLTSAESSDRHEEIRPMCSDKQKNKVLETCTRKRNFEVLSDNEKNKVSKTCTRKRNFFSFEVLSLMEMNPAEKKESACFGLSETFDLNGECMTEFDSGRRTIDLNCNAVEQFIANV